MGDARPVYSLSGWLTRRLTARYGSVHPFCTVTVRSPRSLVEGAGHGSIQKSSTFPTVKLRGIMELEFFVGGLIGERGTRQNLLPGIKRPLTLQLPLGRIPDVPGGAGNTMQFLRIAFQCIANSLMIFQSRVRNYRPTVGICRRYRA